MWLGIDLGGTNLRVGVVDGSAVVESVTVPSMPKEYSLESSIGYLVEVIRPLCSSDIRGIGIGAPSVVDAEQGIVYDVTNIPQWVEVPLKAILEKAFPSKKVSVNNDSNCFTLGEHRFGKGRGTSSMVGITLGTGVGSGIIIDGKLYGGVNTGAGEIGCIPYLGKTLEDYCASKFFTERGLTAKDAAEAANGGDSAMIRLWSEFGRHMAFLVGVAMYAYDPEMIVFGGGLTKAEPLFRDSMNESLKDFAFQKSLEKIRIEYSVLKDVAVLGAASLVMD